MCTKKKNKEKAREQETKCDALLFGVAVSLVLFRTTSASVWENVTIECIALLKSLMNIRDERVENPFGGDNFQTPRTSGIPGVVHTLAVNALSTPLLPNDVGRANGLQLELMRIRGDTEFGIRCADTELHTTHRTERVSEISTLIIRGFVCNIAP
ncbi:hypothetical protein CBL_11222 [Carabus blaptoides fortunei]